MKTYKLLFALLFTGLVSVAMAHSGPGDNDKIQQQCAKKDHKSLGAIKGNHPRGYADYRNHTEADKLSEKKIRKEVSIKNSHKVSINAEMKKVDQHTRRIIK
jgi:hypothetical protein